MSVIILFLLLITTISSSVTPYSPTDHYLLDCGSSSNTTSSLDGRSWAADFSYPQNNITGLSFESTADWQGPSVEQVPYMTARVFRSQFTYTFPVSPGPKFLRLYFYPAVYSGIPQSRFSFTVTSGPHTLLTNFTAGVVAAMEPPQRDSIVKEFRIHVPMNNNNNNRSTTLNITFSPSSPGFYAFVNGIEVCSMAPDNINLLLYNNGIPLVGTKYMFTIDNYTALETAYRLNVGGSSIRGENDTGGMFRKWRDDLPYIYGTAFGQVWQRDDADIRYNGTTSAFTAPTAVYSSGRTMGPDPNINLNYNLTWVFPVDSGFQYLVRLHFCEIDDNITRVNERVFYVFLNREMAEKAADVVAWSGGAGIPIYRDYVVDMASSIREGKLKQDLWLELHPDMGSKPHYANAILNGVEIFKVNGSDGSLAGPNPEQLLPAPQQNSITIAIRGGRRLSQLIIIIAAAAALLLLLLFAVLCLVCLFIIVRRRRKARVWSTPTHSELPKEICRCFALSQLREATNDFDDLLIIGRGGFGDVYKGYVDDCNTLVAIKRLKSKSKQGAREFLTEIETLSQLRHRHLVSLIGYCEEEGEMMLVYDYMRHGTLRDHLYHHRHPLPWKQRLEICIGAARGFDYLHAGARYPIIHRDIKSTNILLDDKWVARVSDFGLSKIGATDVDTVVTTVVKGTFGYMDPEYYKRMKLTQKSDVYSFGVVLLEVICGRPAVDRNLEYEEMNLANWARGCIEKGRVYEIIDPILSGQIAPDCMHKFVETAYDCLHDQGVQRPTMDDVVARLEFALNLQDLGVNVPTMQDPLSLLLPSPYS